MDSSMVSEHASVTGSSPEPTSTSERSNVSSNFFKNLSEKRVNRDGTKAKRRGPKPDSKPALTRRQELNRQAQRTHRERKELYVKALEDEILRLKETFTHVSQDKDRLAEENRLLRDALAQAGIPYPSSEALFNSPSFASRSPNPAGEAPSMALQYGDNFSGSAPMPPIVQKDNEQTGIDFVLTLERPCMMHMGVVCSLAEKVEEFPCGHALMATCPPKALPEPLANYLWGSSMVPGGADSGIQTWEVSKSSLSSLLNLSSRLDLDGEMTPVMAWGMISSHERFNDLTPNDVARLAEDLQGKVRCYGFGAVMEQFEVRDAMQNAFFSRHEIMAS